MTGSVSDPLVRVEGLTKSFGALAANDQIDLNLAEGEIHALIGPNGAGKTTFLAQLTGEILPDSGRIFFAGHEVTKFPVHKRAGMGLIRAFQIVQIFSDFSVRENIKLALLSREAHAFRFWRPVAADRRLNSAALEFSDLLGLCEKVDWRTEELSHGDKRRLELAMTLASRPKALLLDEPLAGLGAEESEKLTTILQQLKESYAVLLVEHDMDAVFKLADRITVLVEGRVIASGPPASIRENQAVQEAYLGDDAPCS